MREQPVKIGMVQKLGNKNLFGMRYWHERSLELFEDCAQYKNTVNGVVKQRVEFKGADVTIETQPKDSVNTGLFFHGGVPMWRFVIATLDARLIFAVSSEAAMEQWVEAIRSRCSIRCSSLKMTSMTNEEIEDSVGQVGEIEATGVVTAYRISFQDLEYATNWSVLALLNILP